MSTKNTHLSKRKKIIESALKRGQADSYLEVESKHGVEFHFVVHHNRVDVVIAKEPHQPKGRPTPDRNWQTALSEEQKAAAFALILDEYRNHSAGDEHGYRGAALGIAGNRIFLGANTPTTQLASSYFKDCAEQNMVNGAADRMAYELVQEQGFDTKVLPKAPVFDAVYVMVGVDQNKSSISCPCGKCTDMLGNHHNMQPDGKIYALPLLTDEMRKRLKPKRSTIQSDGYIHIESSDENASSSPPVTTLGKLVREENHYTIWQTRISHLNSHREITLAEPQALSQREAYSALCARAQKIGGLLEERARQHYLDYLSVQKPSDQHRLRLADMFDEMVDSTKHKFDALKNSALQLFLKDKSAEMRKAAENEFLERPSIAKLDCATTPEGVVRLDAMNQFMLDQITHTLADRMRGQGLSGKSSPRRWMKENITAIRCVVIQLDDGTFRSATQASGTFDTSMPNAEAVAAVAALPALGRNGIRHVWVMEMNPGMIEKGVLPTSPKEGIERLAKRASADVDFTYLPINSGKLNAEAVKSIAVPLGLQALSPALFVGARGRENGKAAAPKLWTDFARAQHPLQASIA